jgi:putative PIN family toxin of toxin-antitoxin system
MKIVLDTNVLVSGLMYPGSVPGRIVTAWREGRFDLVLTVEQLTEIGRVLAYPKIRKILKWDDETIGRFLRQLLLRGELVEPAKVVGTELRDSTDSPILGCLVASNADWLVTGDGDLLEHRDDFPILEPSAFEATL